MKQAFLITSYRDFEWLKKSVDVHVAGKAVCFIHIGRRTAILPEFREWAESRKKRGGGLPVFPLSDKLGSYKLYPGGAPAA